MMQFPRKAIWIWIFVISVGLAVPALAGAPADETFACVDDDKLDQSVAPEAQVEELACFFKTYEGINTLHFKVTLKNASDKEQRYKVNIFLDNGKAVGGLIPRTTKGGLVAPGASASFIYPVVGMPEKAQEVTLSVRPIEP